MDIPWLNKTDPPLPPPAYYNTDDIAAIMRCCGKTAREIARGFEMRGQAIRIGRRMMVAREVFDAWRRQQDGTEAFFKVPLTAVEGGGGAKDNDRRTRAYKLQEENERLKAQLAELTRPKKRGRPPKARAAT